MQERERIINDDSVFRCVFAVGARCYGGARDADPTSSERLHAAMTKLQSAIDAERADCDCGGAVQKRLIAYIAATARPAHDTPEEFALKVALGEVKPPDADAKGGAA